MQVFYGSKSFITTEYESNPINFQISADIYWLDPNSASLSKYVFQENRVQSDDRYMSLGFKDEEYTFYSA